MSKKVIATCDLCSCKFQMGPHQYDGKYSSKYKISVCRSCWEGNWDGWNPRHERLLINNLKEHGCKVPQRNDKGLLPRD